MNPCNNYVKRAGLTLRTLFCNVPLAMAVCLTLFTCVSCQSTSKLAALPMSDAALVYQHQMHSAFDSQQLLVDLKILSSDTMQGRKPLTEGSIRAQHYIEQRFKHIGAAPFFDTYKQAILQGDRLVGHNLVALLPASENTQKFVVISAHYDHLGSDFSGIYYGADDNASGVAGLLQIAHSVKHLRLPVNLIFLATDAEETGLYGSKAFVDYIQQRADIDVILNINLDMIAQGGSKQRLYFAASRNNELLTQIYQQLFSTSSDITVVRGHSQKGFKLAANNSRIDWPNASDHAPFRKVGIPYIYFGVDPHRYYHTPSDDYARIPKAFFIASTKTILTAVAIVLAEFQ